ncbi:ribonuclease E inhibitor RraB [Tritonibacter sp. SIMBA_163]|uniref:ribonuclease E inhibitor RraB n=1 Tax=Tritonibacter sp. SIMBA_163 TaxID=3080868 RepID=UPI00397F9DBB
MDSDALDHSDILRENSKILLRLEKNGLDTKKKRDFEFSVSLPTKENCKEVRQVFRNKYKVPEGGMFIIIDDPEDFQLVLCVEMRPTAEYITEIEKKLLESSNGFDSVKVLWEFKE